MYDKMFEDMKTRMKPVMDLAETNKKVLESLANLQKETLTDVVNTNLEQFQALSQCKDPKSALDLQVKYFKTLETKMAESTEKSLAAMNEAKDAFVSLVEDSAKKTAVEVEEAVKKASKQAA